MIHTEGNFSQNVWRKGIESQKRPENQNKKALLCLSDIEMIFLKA